MRITLADAREEFASIPNANLCAEDPRTDALINRCQRRIIEKSRADLLHRRIRLCIDDNCVVTPRGIVALTDAAIWNTPIPIKNGWYEFLPINDGVFVEQDTDLMTEVSLHYRQEVPHLRNITTTGSTIKLYTDVSEAPEAYVMLYGYDNFERKIRSDWDTDGEPEDGIRISIAGPGNTFTSTQTWLAGGLLRVQKSPTRGRVLMYEVNPSTLAETLLAIYEDDEEKPSYKQYLIRGFSVCVSCQPATFTAMAKLEFIPARTPEDELIVPSLEALRLMAEAVLKMDNNQFSEGAGISREAMRHFGDVRDHNTPKEQIAISLRTQGNAYLSRRRIGGIV